MGGGGSKPRQSTEQKQTNNNRIIDQSRDSNALLQLNWASFGSGASSVIIIIALLVLLFYCWRQNRKASAKTHSAQLHEMAAITGHGSGNRCSDQHRPSQYPGGGGYPGNPPPSYPGFPGVNPMFPPGPYGGYSAVPTQQPVNAQQLGQALASLGGLAALAGPAPDWGRIHEVGPPRARVTYQDEMPPPESILRRSSSRRNLGGLSRSNSFHSVHEGTGLSLIHI